MSLTKSFPSESAAKQFVIQNGFTIQTPSTFPPDEKELKLNHCFVTPNPPSNPREWQVICNVLPRKGNVAKPL